MSNSVDQRIVEMQFDNSQFEKGVASTISSLKNLEDNLTLKNGTKGLAEVQNAIDNINFKSILGETSSFGEALNGLKDTASGVFSTITDHIGGVAKAYGLVKGIFNTGIAAKAITGGWSRASNLNKAAFKLESMGIGWAKVAKQVDNAVSGTAFSLDAAATAASMFASSGMEVRGEGDKLEQSLKAVANLASVSGNSFERLSEIFTKAAAQGKVSGLTMQSLTMAGVNASALLTEHLKVSAEQLEDMQRKGEITFDNLVEAVNSKYGEAAGLANKSFDGALANMWSALSRSTADLFQYGQTAMIDVFNGLRESINAVNWALNPLMRTWTEVDEATGKTITKKGVLIRFFEDTAKAAGEAFHQWGGKVEKGEGNSGYISEGPERLRRLFQEISDGLEGPLMEIAKGTKDLVWGSMMMGMSVREIFRLALEFISPIGMAFHDIFGDGTFAKGTKAFREFAQQLVDTLAHLQAADGYINIVRTAFGALFTIVKTVGEAIVNIFGGAVKLAMDTAYAIATGIGAIFNAINFLFKAGANAGELFSPIFDPIVEFLNSNGLGFVVDFFRGLGDGLGKVVSAISGEEGAFERLSEFFNGLSGKVGEVTKSIGEALGGFGENLRSAADGVKAFFTNEDTINKFKYFFDLFKDNILAPTISNVGEALTAIGDAFHSVFDNVDFSPEVPQFIKDFGDAVRGIIDGLRNGKNINEVLGPLGDRLSEFGKGILGSAALNFLKFSNSVKKFSENFKDKAHEKAIAFFDRLKLLWEKVGPKLSDLGNRLSNIWDRLKKTFSDVKLSPEPILDFFSKISDAIANFFDALLSENFDSNSLASFVHNIADSFGGLKDTLGSNFKEVWTSIGRGIYDNVEGPLKSLTEWIFGLGDSITEAKDKVSDGTSAIVDTFRNLKIPGLSKLFGDEDQSQVVGSKLTEDSKSIFSIVDTIKDVINGLTSPIDALTDIFSGIFNGAFDAFEKFIAKLDTDKLKQFASFIISLGMNAMMLVGFYESMMMLKKIGDLASSIGEAIGAFGKIGDAIKGLSNSIGASAKTLAKAELIKAIAITLGVLIGGIIALSLVDSDKAWTAVAQISVLVIVLGGVTAGILALTKKLNGLDFASLGLIGKAALELVGAVAILAILSVMLSRVNPEDLGKGLLSIVIIIGILLGSLAGLSKIGDASKKLPSLLKLAGALLVMYAAIKLFAGIPVDEFVYGMSLLAGAIIALYLLAKIAELAAKPMKKIGKGFMQLGIGIGILAVAVGIISSMPVENLATGFGIVIGLLILLGVYAFILKAAKLDLTLIAVSSSLIALAASIAIIGAAIALIGYLVPDTEKIKAAAVAMMGVILAFTLLLTVMALLGGKAVGATVSVIGAAIALGVLVAALLLLGSVPFEQIQQGAGVLAGVIIGLIVALVAIGAITTFFADGFFILAIVFAAVGASALMIAGAFMIVVQAFNLLGMVAPVAMAGILKAIDMFVEYVNANRSKVAQAAANMLIGIAEGIYLAIPDVMMYLFLAIGEIAAGLVMGAPLIIAGFTEAMDKFSAKAGPIIEKTGKAIMDGLKGILKGAIDGIINGLKGLGDQAKVAFDDAIYKITDGAFGKKAEEATKEIADKANEGFSGSEGGKFGDTMVEGTDESIEQVRNLGDKAKEATEEVKEKAMSSFNGEDDSGVKFDLTAMSHMSPEEIQASVKEITENIDASNIGGVIGEHLSSATQITDGEGMPSVDLASMSHMTLEDLTASKDQIVSNIDASGIGTDVPESIKNVLTEGFGSFNIGTTMADADFFNTDIIMSKINEVGQSMPQTLENTVGDTSKKMDYTKAVFPEGSLNVGKITSEFRSAANSGVSAFSSTLTEKTAAVDLTASVKKVADKAKQTKLFKDGGSANGKALADGTTGALKNLSKDVKDKVSSAISSATGRSVKNDAKSGGSDVGENLGQGTIDGLNSKSNDLYDAACAIIANALKGMKKTSNQASPSKETIKIGAYMTKGLIIGLNGLKNDFYKASESLISDGLRAMSVEASYMSELIDNIDDQPVIRPVLDLSDYETGISQMSGMSTKIPMIAAGYAGGRILSTPSSPAAPVGGGITLNVSLNYAAGDSANKIALDIANELQSKLLLEGV